MQNCHDEFATVCEFSTLNTSNKILLFLHQIIIRYSLIYIGGKLYKPKLLTCYTLVIIVVHTNANYSLIHIMYVFLQYTDLLFSRSLRTVVIILP